jgi:universal stress protein E
MNPIRRILIAVKNPDSSRQAGVDKAIDIARQLGAAVELFHAISTPVFLEIEPIAGHSLAQIKRESLKLRTARLKKLAQRAQKKGVKATSHVAWDFPPHEAIVRRADSIHADLIIAECHEGKRLAPWLLHLTDWELLRLSSRPVLLLKNDQKWREPVILGAVDPAHAHAKPAGLDAEILAQASGLGRKLKGSFELMHANFPTGFALLAATEAPDGNLIASAYEAQKTRSKTTFEKFAREARIPTSCCHLLDTDPVFAIPQIARAIGADLVVMGAVSRSGLKRVLIGNTAERVLAKLPCDVLVVKPPRFQRRVETKARGMRVIAPPPVFPLAV